MNTVKEEEETVEGLTSKPIVKIRHNPQGRTFIVTITLPLEALQAINLAIVKIKSPTKKQYISGIREDQVTKYNDLVLKEQRELRYKTRRRSGSLERTPSPTPSGTNDANTTPSRKRVKFLL
ncbi:uncharacterized protein J8A68_003987 [[Candida] subhashii]|uniref:Uncharacterized protein n=1 Tax=[Candida] subhashii TaxID=561895 RepID=A0A8J5QK44_9ASCO|nr:uncharacterized protein J8A68_003987 [[Candida] subhashii]KAG7662456.1 hypothetical protein J8A68_003987 [[Candida] subhashii]